VHRLSLYKMGAVQQTVHTWPTKKSKVRLMEAK